MPSRSSEPWYAEGLAFTCQNCGSCCRGPGGYVWVTEAEAQELARHTGEDFPSFAAKWLRSTPEGYALIDNPRGDCPLLDDNGRCAAYQVRPMQCRTWPWWEENLISRERWDRVAQRCPGMNHGDTHSRLFIETEAAKSF